MKVGFLIFAKVHSRPDTASSRIRAQWLIKYWPEAEEWHYGRHYDAAIFQKVYDYEIAKTFPGVKILDCCDPDFFDRQPFIQMVQEVDAITVPTEVLRSTIQGMTDKPVVIILDRLDLEFMREKKIHRGRAKEVCWYGYSHNFSSLRSLRESLLKYDLGISFIADKPISIDDKTSEVHIKERYTKWNLETVNKEIIKSDFVVMPGSRDPNYRFKSNNKTVNAWALGMPVAVCVEEVERFLDPEERKKEAEVRLKEVKDLYDVRLSVNELKGLICTLQAKRESDRKVLLARSR